MTFLLFILREAIKQTTQQTEESDSEEDDDSYDESDVSEERDEGGRLQMGLLNLRSMNNKVDCVLELNLRSMNNKVDYVLELNEGEKFDVFLSTETWLKPSNSKEVLREPLSTWPWSWRTTSGRFPSSWSTCTFLQDTANQNLTSFYPTSKSCWKLWKKKV